MAAAVRLDPWQNIIAVSFPEPDWPTVVIQFRGPDGAGVGGGGAVILRSTAVKTGEAVLYRGAYGLITSVTAGPLEDPGGFSDLSRVFTIQVIDGTHTGYVSIQDVIAQRHALYPNATDEVRYLSKPVLRIPPFYTEELPPLYFYSIDLMGIGDPVSIDIMQWAVAVRLDEKTDKDNPTVVTFPVGRLQPNQESLSWTADLTAYSSGPGLEARPDGTIHVELGDASIVWSASLSAPYGRAGNTSTTPETHHLNNKGAS